jgi:hypothetical protein
MRRITLLQVWVALAGSLMLWGLCAATASAANVTEPYVIGGNASIDTVGANTELPQRTTAPAAGSGFRWGGRTNGTDIVEARSAGQIRFKAGGNANGSYYYTIFDSTGAQSPPAAAAVVNHFYKVTFTTSDTDAGEQIRLMVRRVNGASAYPDQEWYLSDPVAVGTAATYNVLVSSVNWAPLSGASNAMLNPLAAADELLLTTSSAAVSWAATGVTQIDGGGFYVESGNGADWRTRTLTTWAEGPQISASPSPLLFTKGSGYEVDVEHGGLPTTHTLTLSNPGATNLSVNTLAWSGTNAAEFSVVSTPTLPLVIAPAGSSDLIVQFAPTQTSRTLGLSATLTATSDDPAVPSLPITINGDATPVTLSRFAIE